VETVQAPAWVERDGRRLALAPGMQLENRDRLLTGRGARAIVQLADGSAVKFGENVNAAVNAMKQGENGFFTAALDVSKGAFRLTTDVSQRSQRQRAINIRAGTLTVGIRGTDVSGRSNDENDSVCLLEGHVAVSHPLGEPSELAEPMQFLAADKGQAPAAIATANKVLLAKWALETELNDGVGTQQTGGRWALDFGRLDKDGALTLHDQLSVAGYAGRIRPVRAPGGYLYELRLKQLVTEREAQSLADKLARELNIPVPAISRH
ncbi:MAG TPA: FecR domain-containing protein, partial [Azonexus sp.]|nr:FecR domain-containing protein [Azonexus sp.]